MTTWKDDTDAIEELADIVRKVKAELGAQSVAIEGELTLSCGRIVGTLRREGAYLVLDLDHT
jgi:hypothetical protein